MINRRLSVGAIYYGGLAVVLLGIFVKLWSSLLPTHIANSINYNSEGFFVAFVLAAWLQFARPHLVSSAIGWVIAGLVALLSLVIGIDFYVSTLLSQFKTLNEVLIAIGFAIVYLQFERPLPRVVPWVASGVVLAIAVLGNATQLIGNLSEGVGTLFLVPLAFDVIDPAILRPGAYRSPWVRYGWYAALVAVFVVVSALMHSGQLTGVAYAAAHYINRSHECLIGIFLLETYFAVGLGRTASASEEATSLVPASSASLSSQELRPAT